MNKEILILGKGFIGRRLQEAFDGNISDRKILSLEDVQREIDEFKPRILINAIGHVGRNVDDCELDKDKTLITNTFIPIILSEAALRNKIRLVHISSACIYHFDYAKDKPITEEKIPDFFDLYYSRSKIYAEGVLKSLCDKYNILIIRLRVPLDNRPHPRNLLTKLIGYKKVINLPNSVTYIPDFINALKYLLKIKARGIYNIVNEGGLLYSDMLDIYKKYVPDFEYKVVSFRDLNLVRTNVIISTKKLGRTGFKVRHIADILEECVRGYLKYGKR